jgi:cyanuric acid amidohydrolase
MKVAVHKVAMDAPDDTHGIINLIQDNIIRPNEIVAIMVKTEGNGNVNDFTRGFASYAIQNLLAGYLDCTRSMIIEKVSIVCSGGCEGVMSPHATIFTRSANSSGQTIDEKRLAIGIKNTRRLLPEEIGKSIHAKEVAKGVKEAMIDADIKEIKDVHFVQIKCPLLTSDRINNAEERGKKVITQDTLKSMAYSRGASALGVAIALQEIDDKRVTDSVICNDWSLYSSVASASAGIELMNNEIIVMGNSDRSSSGEYIIGHSIMNDPLDSAAVIEALRTVGLHRDTSTTTISRPDKQKLINVFAKAGGGNGIVRGRRTTMLTDSDISSTRHARSVVNAVIASIVGDPMIYVSGGSEHQGPMGGGPIAVIAHM